MKMATIMAALAMASALAWAGWPGTTEKEYETDESGWPVGSPSSTAGNLGRPSSNTGRLSGSDLRCSYFHDFTYSGDLTFGQRDPRIDQMIEDIVKIIGLRKNFEIYSTAEVSNAAAGLRGDKRIIAYNPNFLNEMVGKTGTDWSVKSILAHEIGHHLQGHTLQEGGSRPPIEIEADEYSGAAMRMLGASLQEAQIAMKTLGSPRGSATHPARNDRLAAIAHGYHQAANGGGATARPTAPQFPNPNPTPFPRTNTAQVATACCGPTGPMCPMTVAVPVGSTCACYFLGRPLPIVGMGC